MTTTGANEGADQTGPDEQTGGSMPYAKSRAEWDRVLADLAQIEEETFQDYLQTARRDGGNQCAVTQGYIELSRRIWQNAQKAARDARERM